jgi:hypothetical protein
MGILHGITYEAAGIKQKRKSKGKTQKSKVQVPSTLPFDFCVLPFDFALPIFSPAH